MELATYIESLRRRGAANEITPRAHALAFAKKLDSQDTLKDLRNEFIIPTKASLAKTSLDGAMPGDEPAATPSKQCIYLAAHGQGLQPKAIRRYVDAQLEAWASVGVRGHYTQFGSSPLVTDWHGMAGECARRFAPIVGSLESEIVVMNTLSVNLHLMMASFYKPTAKRHKVLIEAGPFPSDEYVVESQIRWHGKHTPEESIVRISSSSGGPLTISTDHILRVIDNHAEEAAFLLLPGVQYYTGQYFDMATITAYAKQRGIVVGWDIAHAVGNVELKLHEWDVDFAVWCNYKYVNSGPGSIGGAFIHEKHGSTLDLGDGAGRSNSSSGGAACHPRLSGWYGNAQDTRFDRDKRNFTPIDGAAGFQVSNPSCIDLAILSAALSVLGSQPMSQIRSKSLALTGYTEYLLDQMLDEVREAGDAAPFTFITPRDVCQRGAQLSLQFSNGETLDAVMHGMEQEGILCDGNRPDYMRLAPSPLYTRFEDMWMFAAAMRKALGLAELPSL